MAHVACTLEKLIPEEILQHICLESFRSGQLQIMVDSAAHLAELNLMIREGLLDQMRELCPQAGLLGMKLIRGQWYHTDQDNNRVPIYK